MYVTIGSTTVLIRKNNEKFTNIRLTGPDAQLLISLVTAGLDHLKQEDPELARTASVPALRIVKELYRASVLTDVALEGETEYVPDCS